MRRSRFFLYAAVGLTMLTVLGLAAGARAQHTPDPYNIVGEGNLGYETSMYPSYPNGVGFSSNQGILQGRAGMNRSNQFQSYIDGLDGFSGSDLGFGAARGQSGAGVPYYRAHHSQEFDEAFNRIYTPNADSEHTFRADQEARTKLYIEYLKESDPKKRAELYRAYTQQTRRTARDLGVGTSRAAMRNQRPTAATPSAFPSALAPAAPAAAPAREAPGTSRPNPYRIPSRMPSSPRFRRPTSAPVTRAMETPEDILERATSGATSTPTTRPSRPPAGAGAYPPPPR